MNNAYLIAMWLYYNQLDDNGRKSMILIISLNLFFLISENSKNEIFCHND